MKKHINSNYSKTNSALLTLGILFLLFFSLAFACGENKTEENEDGSDPPVSQQNRRSGSLTEADVKNWINEYEHIQNPTGGISSPISFEISFEQIQFAETRAANEGDKLRGVKSSELYMIIVSYTLQQKFNDGTYPKQKKQKCEFYRNAQGGWSAFNYGPA